MLKNNNVVIDINKVTYKQTKNKEGNLYNKGETQGMPNE